MARIDGKLTAAGEAVIDVAELARLFAESRGLGEADRHLAISRYLSAGDGWRDAGQSLGGAFAAAGRSAATAETKKG